MSSSQKSAKSDNFTNSIIKSIERMAKWFFGEFIPKASKVIWKGCSAVAEGIIAHLEYHRYLRLSSTERPGAVAGLSVGVLIVGILAWALFWKLFTP